MDKIGQYRFVIDAYLTDFRGKATLPMIGGFMLQAATKHAEERGFGYTYMAERKRVWVLSRIAIEMYEYPQNDTVMIINTWIASVNRLFTERLFSFEDESGKQIGFARSLWASIDMENRKPTNILELEGMVKLVDESRPCPIRDMAKIPLLKEGFEPVDSFIIRYSDVDINKHLNSMKYIEHLIDVFDIEMFRTMDIGRLEINYLAEGLYDAHIDVARNKEEGSTYVLEMKDKESSICSARIKWQ